MALINSWESYVTSLPRREVVTDWLRIDLCVRADGGREVEKDRCCLKLKLLCISFPAAPMT